MMGDEMYADHAFLAASGFRSVRKALSEFLLYVMLSSMQETEQEQRNRGRRERYALLTDEEKQKRTSKIPRIGTLSVMDSSWKHLRDSQNVAGFITVTGIDLACFRELLSAFSPLFWNHTPYSRVIDGGRISKIDPSKKKGGRPRMVSCHACLGMVLFWTRTKCHYWTIAQFFDFTGSVCELWLRFGKRLLLHVLSQREDTQVKMPTADKCKEYIAAVSRKYHSLNSVGLVGDGLKVPIQKATDARKQNAFYNGWKSDHYITNLFVFGPDGLIVACIF